MDREFINPRAANDPTPLGYNHIAKVRNAGATLFIAGQGAANVECSLVGEVDTEAHARQAFRNAATS